jgi:cyclase
VRQITSNVFAETQVRGCNHGFVTTSEGVVMIDSPQKPTDALKWRAEIEKHGQLKYIINTEPHGDHWTGNAYFDAPVVAHEGVRTRILETDLEEHLARVGSMGPEEPKLLEGYFPNAPVITFQNGMTMHVGDHTFEMIHMPRHGLFGVTRETYLPRIRGEQSPVS